MFLFHTRKSKIHQPSHSVQPIRPATTIKELYALFETNQIQKTCQEIILDATAAAILKWPKKKTVYSSECMCA